MCYGFETNTQVAGTKSNQDSGRMQHLNHVGGTCLGRTRHYERREPPSALAEDILNNHTLLTHYLYNAPSNLKHVPSVHWFMRNKEETLWVKARCRSARLQLAVARGQYWLLPPGPSREPSAPDPEAT